MTLQGFFVFQPLFLLLSGFEIPDGCSFIIHKNKRYLSKQDDIKICVPIGKREEIKIHAIEKGYAGIQPYLKALIEKDSGIEL